MVFVFITCFHDTHIRHVDTMYAWAFIYAWIHYIRVESGITLCGQLNNKTFILCKPWKLYMASSESVLRVADLNKRQTRLSPAPGSNNPFRESRETNNPFRESRENGTGIVGGHRLNIASHSGRWWGLTPCWCELHSGRWWGLTPCWCELHSGRWWGRAPCSGKPDVDRQKSWKFFCLGRSFWSHQLRSHVNCQMLYRGHWNVALSTIHASTRDGCKVLGVARFYVITYR